MRPETEAFLDLVRDAEAPTRADEDRVLRALQASIAVGVTSSVVVSSAVPSGWLAKFTTGLGAFGSKLSVVAVCSVAALSGADTPRPPPIAAVASAKTQVIEPRPTASATESRPNTIGAADPAENEAISESPPPPPPRVATGTRAAPADSDATLRSELRLLEEVQTALRRGDGESALRALDRHRTTDRLLLAERDATRVLALCAAGRVAEAQRAGVEFSKRHPGSIQREAIAKSCATAQRISED